ncbi:unnamed protein product [Mytilus coruscus]|uniref:Apple domain-containing protein n=1 Tax=Mytilus coruscus TaxID=42192 RepID=A0A6J8EDL2_MYTCO|nr:unnamed protein product [Mytilus coruscus]
MRLSIYQGLLLLYKLFQTSAEQCTSETFRINPDKRDVKLRGFTYRTFENISSRAYFKKCIRRKRCHSYNYNRVSLRCELNLKPMYISEDYFKNVVGYVYAEVHHYRGIVKTPTEAFQNVAFERGGQGSTYNNEHAEYADDGLTNTALIRNRTSLHIGSRLHDLDITVGTHLDDMSIFAHYTGPAADNEHLVFQRSSVHRWSLCQTDHHQGPEMLHVRSYCHCLSSTLITDKLIITFLTVS